MSRSARKTQPAVATAEFSAKTVLAAAKLGVITLKKAERDAFRKMQIPLVLRADQPMYDALTAFVASQKQNDAEMKPKAPAKKSYADLTERALDELDAEGFEPENDGDLEAAVAQKIASFRTTNDRAQLAEEITTSKKALRTKKAKVVEAPVVEDAPKAKRAPKGEGKSRTPEARKARRILREYLRVSLVATDENEDAEIRAVALARAEYLEQLIGASV